MKSQEQIEAQLRGVNYMIKETEAKLEAMRGSDQYFDHEVLHQERNLIEYKAKKVTLEWILNK